MSQLIVTGAPVAHRFLLPEDADYIKLPSAAKVGVDRFAPRSLPVEFDDIWNLRGRRAGPS